MNDTKAQFLQIIRDYITGRKTNIENVNEELHLYATQHQLSPIVYFQTKVPSLLSSYSQAVSSYVNRKRLCKNLLETMSSNGVDAFQIKGAVIASYYPQLTVSSMLLQLIVFLKTVYLDLIIRIMIII